MCLGAERFALFVGPTRVSLFFFCDHEVCVCVTLVSGMGPCAFLELLSLGGWASGGEELLMIAPCPILCRAARLRRQGPCCDHSDRGCGADEMSSSTYIVTQGVGRANPSTMTMIDVRVESSKLSGLSEDLLIWTL